MAFGSDQTEDFWAAAWMAVGVLLAAATIYLATGWMDGFGDPGVWALKRRLLRRLPWVLAAGALVGAGMGRFHEAWIHRQGQDRPPGKLFLVAVPRVFLHFPLYGFLLLIQLLGWLGFQFLVGLGRWFRPGPVGPIAKTWAFGNATALWFMLGPLGPHEDDEGNRLEFQSPTLYGARMARLFPFVLLAIWIWVGGTNEDTGDRVDPFLLSLAASYWIGDFLVLGWKLWPGRRAWGSD